MGDMTKNDDNSTGVKISPPFRARLRKLAPTEKIQAIVLIRTPQKTSGAGRRQSREQRQATIAAIQSAAESAYEELDRILAGHNGQRLAESETPNALGCIPIEATAQGVLAVAESELVKAVLEDQPISLLK